MTSFSFPETVLKLKIKLKSFVILNTNFLVQVHLLMPFILNQKKFVLYIRLSDVSSVIQKYVIAILNFFVSDFLKWVLASNCARFLADFPRIVKPFCSRPPCRNYWSILQRLDWPIRPWSGWTSTQRFRTHLNLRSFIQGTYTVSFTQSNNERTTMSNWNKINKVAKKVNEVIVLF